MLPRRDQRSVDGVEEDKGEEGVEFEEPRELRELANGERQFLIGWVAARRPDQGL